MVLLKDIEIEWLRENFPQLSYDSRKNEIVGKLSFCKKYKELKAIKETYAVRIDFSSMRTRKEELPKVYNTDGRIKRFARIKKVDQVDFHMYPDDSLCLIFPLKIKDRYPRGFTLSLFMEDLANYLYWVTYKSRYNIEPWQGEAHGMIALLLNYMENPTRWLDTWRKYYNNKFKKNITKAKMRKILAQMIHEMKQKGELC